MKNKKNIKTTNPKQFSNNPINFFDKSKKKSSFKITKDFSESSFSFQPKINENSPYKSNSSFKDRNIIDNSPLKNLLLLNYLLRYLIFHIKRP